jgi:UDP-N-acetylmuramate-alanine ligase
VSSEKLAEAVKDRGVDVIYGGDLVESEKKIRELTDGFDIILVLGAGDVYELAKNLVK